MIWSAAVYHTPHTCMHAHTNIHTHTHTHNTPHPQLENPTYLLAGGPPAGDGTQLCCQQQRLPEEHRQAVSWVMIRSVVVYWRGAAAGSSATLPLSAAITVARIPPAFWWNSGYGHNMADGR
ncbi:hypothetical protein NDU88_001945 [Pleurodeles waltl]|uniref:Uncharacterized protein n=1 Tax=Pleurodeles waltl TaxID=8319 RepID=A0AAV7TK81_PLEWA|nr:hypothetical protein NDU88_001945 [Pleurodeles waltl]